mgnify:CR=1 FL=1
MTADEALTKAIELKRKWRDGSPDDRADVAQVVARGPAILAAAVSLEVVPGFAAFGERELWVRMIEAAQ